MLAQMKIMRRSRESSSSIGQAPMLARRVNRRFMKAQSALELSAILAVARVSETLRCYRGWREVLKDDSTRDTIDFTQAVVVAFQGFSAKMKCSTTRFSIAHLLTFLMRSPISSPIIT